MNTDDIAGKVVVITGAGNGQGAAAAKLFASNGCHLVLFDRDPAGLQRTLEALPDVSSPAGQGHLAVQGDVTLEADLESLGDKAMTRFGTIDVLYNNAGIDLRGKGDGKFDKMDPLAVRRTIDVNLMGVINGCRAIVPRMAQTGGGSVINVASIGALLGVDILAYSASKGGVISFTRSLGVSYGRKGIRANVICPGVVRTALVEELLANEHHIKAIENRCPLGRIAEPEEIAKVALFLASDASSYVNASVIVADGGTSVR